MTRKGNKFLKAIDYKYHCPIVKNIRLQIIVEEINDEITIHVKIFLELIEILGNYT